MIPKRSTLIALVPPPKQADEFVVEIQTTDDIIHCVYDCVCNSEGFVWSGDKSKGWIEGPQPDYVKNFAPLFLKGNTKAGTDPESGKKIVEVDLDGVCSDIWDFMQNCWPYDPDKAETEKMQTGRTVNYILYDFTNKYFDCKHYATFAYAVLRALGIDCRLRLTSYDAIMPSPSHIYVIAGVGEYDEDKKQWPETFVIDGTMPEYNEESKDGVTQYYTVDIKV